MPRVHGILETALYAKDVKQAADFYRRLFGFATLLESDRLIALNVAGRDVLLLFQVFDRIFINFIQHKFTFKI